MAKKLTKQDGQNSRFQAVVEAFVPWAHRVGEALKAKIDVQPVDNGRVIITGLATLYPLLRQEQDWLFFRADLEQIAPAVDCAVGIGDTAIVAWWRTDLDAKSKTTTSSELQQLDRGTGDNLEQFANAFVPLSSNRLTLTLSLSLRERAARATRVRVRVEPRHMQTKSALVLIVEEA
jgi:hypothetical protein